MSSSTIDFFLQNLVPILVPKFGVNLVPIFVKNVNLVAILVKNVNLVAILVKSVNLVKMSMVDELTISVCTMLLTFNSCISGTGAGSIGFGGIDRNPTY